LPDLLNEGKFVGLFEGANVSRGTRGFNYIFHMQFGGSQSYFTSIGPNNLGWTPYPEQIGSNNKIKKTFFRI